MYMFRCLLRSCAGAQCRPSLSGRADRGDGVDGIAGHGCRTGFLSTIDARRAAVTPLPAWA
jgi:hypothetical protein